MPTRSTHLRSLVHYLDPHGEVFKPTIRPTPAFSPNADAERLKKALSGIGTDEQAIIDILGQRTSAERLEIRQTFAAISQESLHDALHRCLSGDFRDLALTLTKTPWEIMAEALFNAMRGYGIKERVLNEILSSCSRDDIPELKKAYEEAYPKHNLVKDIRTETSGDYRDALLQILEGTLDEPSAVKLRRLRPETVHEITNPLVAETYAEEIHKSGERCPDAVKAMYMRTIITRSPWQIYALDQAYLKTYGSSVTSAIKKGTTGSFKHFLQARVTYALDRPTFYAKLFHFAIAGPGTKDATLQRILALRADVDLQSIKERYELLYGETLLQAISEDTSREYRKLCIQLATECNNV